MENIYSGTGEKLIHNVLNRVKEQQQLRPTFKNKASLKPITAKTVQERNQIDLVNMSSIAITIENKTYKYILSVIDIFSRYLHLRPLESKGSYGRAQALVEIYNDHGTPEITCRRLSGGTSGCHAGGREFDSGRTKKLQKQKQKQFRVTKEVSLTVTVLCKEMNV